MVKNRIDLQIELNYHVAAPGADFVFNIHAAHTPRQTIRSESLVLSQAIPPQMVTVPSTHNRYMRMYALPGALKVNYAATVVSRTVDAIRCWSRRSLSEASRPKC